MNDLHLHDEVWILARWAMNTCMTSYEYLCNGQLESMSSWISFERENCVEDVRDFRLNGEKNHL